MPVFAYLQAGILYLYHRRLIHLPPQLPVPDWYLSFFFLSFVYAFTLAGFSKIAEIPDAIFYYTWLAQ
jgi:hypothetical protein